MFAFRFSVCSTTTAMLFAQVFTIIHVCSQLSSEDSAGSCELREYSLDCTTGEATRNRVSKVK